MTKEYASIPFAGKLSREGAWNRSSARASRFWMLRLHCLFDDVTPSKPAVSQGEILGTAYDPKATQFEIQRSVEAAVEEVDFRESLRESIFTAELAQELSAELNQGIEAKVYRLEIANKALLTARVSSSLTNTSRLSRTVTTTTKRTFAVKSTYGPDTGPLAHVAMYQRREVNVYLVWLDYLVVDYKMSPLGLRLKRVKSPMYADPQQGTRANEVELRIPLGRFSYWRLIRENSWSIPLSDCNRVVDVDDVLMSDVERVRLHERKNWIQTPTLYQLSNAAFPLKYFKRAGDWTDEELLLLEQEEPKQTLYLPSRRAPSVKTNG